MKEHTIAEIVETLDYTDFVIIRKGTEESIPFGCIMIYGKVKVGDSDDHHHDKYNSFCYIKKT